MFLENSCSSILYIYIYIYIAFIVLSESLRSTSGEVFFNKVAGLLAATWLTDEVLNKYFSIILSTFGNHLI